jgi:tetratricopeptide (TPR) repeat protein
MYQHVNAAPTPLRQLCPDVPKALEELVLHLLRKAPEARPADTQEVYARLLPFLAPPGQEPGTADAGPAGAPDPTDVFRRPFAPRAQAPAPGGPAPTAVLLGAPPVPVPAQLREDIKEAYAHSDALLEEQRFAQAAEVLGEVITPAALALGSESRQVLALRRQRAAIRLLGGDYRAALPEFDALADAYARIAGPTGEQARACRAQAARCRAELGQVTDALAALQGVLNVVRAVDSDVSEEAVELRHNIGMLLLAQGRTAEVQQVLEPLHQDMCMVFGPEDEMTVEIAEALAVIRLDLDGSAS